MKPKYKFKSRRAPEQSAKQAASLGKFVAACGHNATLACPSAKFGTALRGMLEMRKKVRKPRARYTVGYGRPPTSSQFQPGQSGNPNGRPKGARNASSMARDALERTINVQGRKMTVRKAAYLRLAERAVAGDAKALEFLLSLESEERPPWSDQAPIEPVSAKDLELLQGFFDRQRASVPQQEQPGAGEQTRRNTRKDNNR